MNIKNSSIEIKKVSLNEIKQLQQLSRQTFAETFSADNSEENMEAYLDNELSIEKLETELSGKNSEFYFAMLDTRVIGYLKINFGDAQTEIQDENALEIERIYVLQEFQGKNAGQLLYRKALDISRDRKLDYIWLGVWEKNIRAIRFYEKNGFTEFDKHIFKLGKDEQTDIMMKLQLKN